MPSRKQRRRRQKERRHEYEYVYVDDEGREVEPPPDEKAPRARRDEAARRDGKAARGKDGGARKMREYQPPSWKRSLRRAALFFPLFFIVFSLVNNGSIVQRIMLSLFYAALFVPLTYLMDRTAYRTYLRRSGGARSTGVPKRR
jgi:hypothetical protein